MTGDRLLDAPDRGLRVAVIGKGGTGKTVVAAGLARALAARGRRVLAADLDSTPGLAMSLGMPATEAGLPLDALEQSPEGTYGWRLATGLSAVDAVERYASRAPGGVRYLGFGRIGATEREATRRSVHAVVNVLRDLDEPGWDVVGDLDAGPTGPFQRFHSFADQVVMVAGPTWASQFATRSLSTLIEPHQSVVMVFNRTVPPVAAGNGRETIAPDWDQPDPGSAANGSVTILPGVDGPVWDRDHPLVPGATTFLLPEDPDLNRAERHGLCPFDSVPPSPAVDALGRLADLLLARSQPSGDTATGGPADRIPLARATAPATVAVGTAAEADAPGATVPGATVPGATVPGATLGAASHP